VAKNLRFLDPKNYAKLMDVCMHGYFSTMNRHEGEETFRHFENPPWLTAAIGAGRQTVCILGNLEALRDWGHAKINDKREPCG